MKVTILFLILFTVSCASTKPGKNYVSTPEYMKRAKVTDSYFKEENKSLSETQIKNLLERRVELPKSLKIAVVKLAHDSSITNLLNHELKAQQDPVIQDINVEMMEKIAGPQKRIKEITLVPQMLMPEEPNFQKLRDVAAIMQADLVLILKTKSRTDSKFHLHKKNEAKAVATVEGLILDVRTGVIPFSSVATNSSQEKETKDFSSEELYLRATLAAENKALAEIFKNVGDHFN